MMVVLYGIYAYSHVWLVCMDTSGSVLATGP